MPLTDKAIKAAQPKAKPCRLADGQGMYLEVMPNGAKYWRLKYRFDGKEKRLALGVYPDVKLAAARDARDEARRLLRDGVDPSAHRRLAKRAHVAAAADSFEGVAREWAAKQAAKWSTGTAEQVLDRLEADVFPWIGARPVAGIEAPDLLAVLRRVEERGAIETAHRIRSYLSRVFRFAIATGRASRDPAADLVDALAPVNGKHYASIHDEKGVAALLRAVEGYKGSPVVRAALRLAPLVFVRPGELRAAEWAEFDLDAGEWRIPAARMKMGVPHIVPLSKQVVAILRELQPLTGRGRFLFPSTRSAERCISDNTLNAALRRLGYTKDEMTAHGFRSMASTLLNEQQWHRDAIERQLAHGEKDKVRAAYNKAEHLPERRRMMQAWADYLDTVMLTA